MERLEQRTRHYLRMMRNYGAQVDSDDIRGELAVTICEAKEAYNGRLEHRATLRTYVEKACRNEMWRYLVKTIRQQSTEVPLASRNMAIPDTTQARLKLRDTLASMDDNDLLLASELVEPSEKVQRAMTAYDSRAKTRSREIGRTADAVAKVYGLSVRSVRAGMQRVRNSIVEGLS